MWVASVVKRWASEARTPQTRQKMRYRGTGLALEEPEKSALPEYRSRFGSESVRLAKESHMYKRVWQSLVLTSLAVLIAIPAVAQVRADLGPLHIRIANDAPPRAQYERRSARPHRNAIWIKGYWHRQDDRWVWIPGRWDQRPDRNARWINARYRREGRAWRYEPAHWSNQQVVEGDDYRQWRSQHPRGR